MSTAKNYILATCEIGFDLFVKPIGIVVLMLTSCFTYSAQAQELDKDIFQRLKALENKVTALEERPPLYQAGFVDITIPAGKTSANVTLKFNRAHEEPPVILTGESGTAGSWVVTKSEKITSTEFSIVALNLDTKPRDTPYAARVGFVVLQNALVGRVEVGRVDDNAVMLFKNLQVGKTYRLSSDTPLMPNWNPKESEVLSAIANMKTIPATFSIEVLEIKTKGNTRWYRVVVSSGDETSGENGWINSLALVGQELVEK